MKSIGPKSDNPVLGLRLLGVPEMTAQDQPFNLPRRQARALLFRLAADERSVPREEIADLLWPEKPPASARRNLTRLLSYLRSEIPQPDLLVVDKTAVSLDLTRVDSDVVQFSRLCQADNPAGWETAVSLYRGPFLSGFALKENLVFDNWLSSELRRLERLYLEALRRLTKSHFNQPERAIRFAEKFLTTDDLAEDLHRQLITLYAATGNRSAALRQYETCVIILDRELGVPPLPGTRAAYEAARDNRQISASDLVPKPEWATLPGLELPLIGRDAAWKTLETAYTRFRQGGVILISGEPGVGKSRLAQEFASAQTGIVLTGNSHADGRTIPYQPIIQALRQALPLLARLPQSVHIWLAETSRLLPELPSNIPHLPPLMEVEPQQAQSRLFEALTQLFLSLASDQRLLICLDDVHWADEGTIGWLQFFSRRLRGSNLCILATYRSHEAAPLGEWRHTLSRNRLMAEVALEGLSGTAVATLLREMQVDISAPEVLAERIHAATGGNAFFVLETLRELVETNQLEGPVDALPLPATVREAVLQRVGRLSPLGQQLLEIAAVLSPLLTFAIIHQAAGRGYLETADHLEELIAHQLLLEKDDQFHFQHELAREAVYLNISGWRRRLLHRRAAKALIDLLKEDASLAAAIAAHFEGAGEIEQAVEYFSRAATAAQTLSAHQEALGFLNRAVELAAKIKGESGPDPKLQEALADNLVILGNFAAAEEAYQCALADTPEAELLQLAELERKLAATLVPQQRLEESEKAYQRALSHLDKLPPQNNQASWESTRLNILLGLLDGLYFQIRPADMANLNQQIQILLDSVGTDEQNSIYYSRLDQMAFLQNRYQVDHENVALAQKAFVYAQKTGKPHLIARRQFSLGFTLLWGGSLDDAHKMLQQTLVSAQALGDRWFQNLCLAYLTVLFRFKGNTVQAAAIGSRLEEVSHQSGNSMYIGVSQANTAWLHYRAGEWKQAQTLAEAAVNTWAKTHYPFQWLAHWPLLAISRRQNRLKDAITSAQALLDPGQQQLPDEVCELLAQILAAWEAGQVSAVRKGLKTAADTAVRHGFL